MSDSLISSILPTLISAIDRNANDVSLNSLLSKFPADTLKSIYKDFPHVVLCVLVGSVSIERFNPIKSHVEMLLRSFIEIQDQEASIYVSIANLLTDFKKGTVPSLSVSICIRAFVEASSKFEEFNPVLQKDGVIGRLYGVFSMYNCLEFYNEFLVAYAYKNPVFVAKEMVSGEIVFNSDILSELTTEFFYFMFLMHSINKIPKQILSHVVASPINLKEAIRANSSLANLAVKHAYEKKDYTAVLWSLDTESICKAFSALGLSYKGTIIQDIVDMEYEGYVPALTVLSMFVKTRNLALLYTVKDAFDCIEDCGEFSPSRLHELVNDVL
jgi:hypothetical protein